MKKKFLALAVAGVSVCSAIALASCGEKPEEKEATYESGYYYANSYSTGFYGLTAKVTVKGDAITAVTVSDAGDATLFNVSAGWTYATETKEAYGAYVQSFVGKKVAEVKAIKVTTSESGQPSAVEGADILCAGQFDKDEEKTGATQTAGRLILAIQNALNEVGNVYVGSYSYANPWNTENSYGATIAVTVKDGKIAAIASANPNYEKFCNISAGWTNAAKTKEAYNAYVQSFVGKTVESIKAMTVTCAENGVPEEVTGVDILCAGQFGEGEEKTGATQTTGRIVLALQDALKNA